MVAHLQHLQVTLDTLNIYSIKGVGMSEHRNSPEIEKNGDENWCYLLWLYTLGKAAISKMVDQKLWKK